MDPLALWGAITGTMAVVIAGRREFISNRARLGIEHGIWYLFGNDPPNLNEAWLLVRVWNDGAQPLTVERVGLDLLPVVVDAERELIVLGTEGQHVEIELRGESVELRPGGPSHSFYAPLGGLVQARVEILDSPRRHGRRRATERSGMAATRPRSYRDRFTRPSAQRLNGRRRG